MNKICPLSMISPRPIPRGCCEEKCAWWDKKNNDCSMALLLKGTGRGSL